MTIIIKNHAQTSTILESTSVIESGEQLPRVVFGREGWDFLKKPRWVTNKTNQREGNFKFYNGSDDKAGTVTLNLHGATRNTNLETLQALTAPIHLTANDIDSNITGYYILLITNIERIEAAELIICSLTFEAYNN